MQVGGGGAAVKDSVFNVCMSVCVYVHVWTLAGPVSGLAVDVTAARRLCATVGDDKQLMLWDAVDCELLAKTVLKVLRFIATCMYVQYVSTEHTVIGIRHTCVYASLYLCTPYTIYMWRQNPSRACHIDKTNSCIAVGCTAGGITLYYLTDQLNKKGGALIQSMILKLYSICVQYALRM